MAHDSEPFTPVPADQALAKEAKLPLGWRDACGSLLVPLNACRRSKLYATWECDHERHEYEKCQYEDMVARMKGLSKTLLKETEEA